jgi:hypothetical protein
LVKSVIEPSKKCQIKQSLHTAASFRSSVGEDSVLHTDDSSKQSAKEKSEGLTAASEAGEAAAAASAPPAIASPASAPPASAAAGEMSVLAGILEAKVKEARTNRQSMSHMSLDQVDRESIERFLTSLRHCKVGEGEGELPLLTMDNDDLDDSARAESIVSLASTGSNKSREHRHR